MALRVGLDQSIEEVPVGQVAKDHVPGPKERRDIELVFDHPSEDERQLAGELDDDLARTTSGDAVVERPAARLEARVGDRENEGIAQLKSRLTPVFHLRTSKIDVRRSCVAQ